jgi:hypothetical protein
MNSDQNKSEINGLTVVVIGSFNPAIFHPLWFSTLGLIRDEEATSAEFGLLTNDISNFSTDWFTLSVTTDRFSIGTADGTKDLVLRDLLIGTFKVLEHTPIRAMGFNSDSHFPMQSEETWHAFGDYYAPKAAWRKIMTSPGLISLTLQGQRDDTVASKVQVKVEPSRQIEHGVYFAINQHYDIEESQFYTPGQGSSKLLHILEQEWASFLSYRESVTVHLLKEFTSK